MFFTGNYQLYVPESAQVGKPVGKIKATDEDLGINADIKYSIINSEGANMFSISTDRDTREGIISLKKVGTSRKRVLLPNIQGSNHVRRLSSSDSRHIVDIQQKKSLAGTCAVCVNLFTSKQMLDAANCRG